MGILGGGGFQAIWKQLSYGFELEVVAIAGAKSWILALIFDVENCLLA